MGPSQTPRPGLWRREGGPLTRLRIWIEVTDCASPGCGLSGPQRLTWSTKSRGSGVLAQSAESLNPTAFNETDTVSLASISGTEPDTPALPAVHFPLRFGERTPPRVQLALAPSSSVTRDGAPISLGGLVHWPRILISRSERGRTPVFLYLEPYLAPRPSL